MTPRAGTALVIGLLMLLIAGQASAQSDYRVVEVEVEGNRIATKSLILGVSSIALGSPLSPTIIQRTMHRLYGLGIFKNVQLEAEEVSGGLKVVIVVSELPKLVELEFSGNDKIKDKKLREELSLGVGGYISPYLVYEKRQAIIDAYADKGYFQAEVDWTLDYNEDSTEASLEYKIKERSKIKVEKVLVEGNEAVGDWTLTKVMRNRKRGFLKSSTFDRDKFPEDKEKVIAEYHKRGYIDAFLMDDSISIDTALNQMSIYLQVYEGPRYYFGRTSFVDNEILPEEFLQHMLKHQADKPFNSEKYEESLMELYSAYQEIGHLHVRIIDDRITRADSLIDVVYSISEGLPSHIRLINITGNTRTKDFVVRREIPVRPGQTFNRSLLIRSVREAMALNFFSNVEPIPIDLPSGDVDLEFHVEEKQTGQISAGAGYNSQDKVVGTVGMGIPNFRGNGQNLSFNVEFGSQRNSFQVSFTEPWLFGRPTLLGVELFALNRRWYDDYTEGRQGGSIRLGRRLRWPDDYFRVYTSYRLERNRFYDYDESFEAYNSSSTTWVYEWTELTDEGTVELRDSVNTVVGPPLQGSLASYEEKWNTASKFTLSLIRDSRDLPEFATHGSILSYTYSKTGGLLGGFWEYQTHRFKVAKFIPLFWKVALATRVEYGVVLEGSGDATDRRVLVSDRFNPGGTAFDGSVRGYDDGILTPDSTVSGADTTVVYYDDPANIDPSVDQPDSVLISTGFTTRVRGKYMIVANAEIQVPIVQNSVYGLLFLDAGRSWLHLEDVKPLTGLYKGYGLGFRVAVPGIGTIGFDFAKPLDEPPNGDDRGWRPHFQIGTTIR